MTDSIDQALQNLLDPDRDRVSNAQIQHERQADRDAANVAERFLAVVPMPTVADLSRNDQHWFDNATIDELLAVGVPSGPEPIMRQAAIRLLIPKPWAPWVARAEAKYSRAARPDRLVVTKAELAHHAARNGYMDNLWAVTQAGYPTVQPEALRMALYREFDRNTPFRDDAEAERAIETPAERRARLEQWAREGREIHWQLLPPGPAKDEAKQEERELRLVRKQLEATARGNAMIDRAVMRRAEQAMRRLVPGTEAYRDAYNKRVAAAGRLRFNKSWLERIAEDEAAIVAQGVERPTVRNPRQLVQQATPLHARPHMPYNHARWS